MNKLLLVLFTSLLHLTWVIEANGQNQNSQTKELISHLDLLTDSLELYPKATYAEMHSLISGYLDQQDSSSAAIVMSQLSGFYNSLQHTARMLETADSSLFLLPQNPSFEVKFRVSLANCRAAARRRHTEDSRRWVDTLGTLMEGVEDTRKMHAYLLSDAITCVREKKLAEALDLVRTADDLVNAEDFPRQQEAVHTIAAIVYVAMGKVKESDEQIHLARSLMNPITRPISRADRLEFLAYNRSMVGEYERAIELLDSAEHMLYGYDAPYNMIRFMLTRGEIIGQLGDWKTANTIFKDVLQQTEKLNADPSNALYWLGISYRGIEDYETAVPLFKRAVEEALAHNSLGDAAYYAEVVSESYEWKDKHKPALLWLKRHIELRDSANNEDALLKQEIATSKYETYRAKQEAKEIAAQAQLTSRNNQLLASILIGLLLISILGLYALQQRAKSIKLKEQESKRMAAEMKQENLDLNQQVNLQALTLTQKNALLKSLENDLSGLKRGEISKNAQAISRLTRSIRNDRTESNNWEVFMDSIKVMHGDLFKALQQHHSDLTTNDHRIIAMIKLNMSTKEMASALSVSEAGIKKARYRVRKKLNLNPTDSLSSYLLKLEHQQEA